MKPTSEPAVSSGSLRADTFLTPMTRAAVLGLGVATIAMPDALPYSKAARWFGWWGRARQHAATQALG